ncbi:MAG TPA: hypothetical protein IGP82_02995 [Thermosynechococcus sp. M55_K2018_012]|nr:hypothetical protein [Thermosynechococcus sp. M55_K2018_012]
MIIIFAILKSIFNFFSGNRPQPQYRSCPFYYDDDIATAVTPAMTTVTRAAVIIVMMRGDTPQVGGLQAVGNWIAPY